MGVSGLLVAGALGASALALSAASFPFVAPGLRKVCIPYVPATTRQLENVAKELSRCSAVSPIVDLGSGDGRVVSRAFNKFIYIIICHETFQK